MVKSGDLDCFGERGDLLPNQEISHSDRESRHVCIYAMCTLGFSGGYLNIGVSIGPCGKYHKVLCFLLYL